MPGWNYISNNAIMCGPSDDRDLGNLYPAVDNDDGSQHYFIAENVAVYGGMKNYLGLNKKWVKNLIVHPGRWSGDACLTAWGGQEHVYSENTCITNNGFPQAFDSSVEGDKCTFNYSDVTSAPFLPSTHGNVYSTPDGTFATGKSTPNQTPGHPRADTSPSTRARMRPAHPRTYPRTGCDTMYDLAALQKLGQELGSTVVKGYDVGDVVAQAAQMLA